MRPYTALSYHVFRSNKIILTRLDRLTDDTGTNGNRGQRTGVKSLAGDGLAEGGLRVQASDAALPAAATVIKS